MMVPNSRESIRLPPEQNILPHPKPKYKFPFFFFTSPKFVIFALSVAATPPFLLNFAHPKVHPFPFIQPLLLPADDHFSRT
jgi:hypothetical protein